MRSRRATPRRPSSRASAWRTSPTRWRPSRAGLRRHRAEGAADAGHDRGDPARPRPEPRQRRRVRVRRRPSSSRSGASCPTAARWLNARTLGAEVVADALGPRLCRDRRGLAGSARDGARPRRALRGSQSRPGPSAGRDGWNGSWPCRSRRSASRGRRSATQCVGGNEPAQSGRPGLERPPDLEPRERALLHRQVAAPMRPAEQVAEVGVVADEDHVARVVGRGEELLEPADRQAAGQRIVDAARQSPSAFATGSAVWTARTFGDDRIASALKPIAARCAASRSAWRWPRSDSGRSASALSSGRGRRHRRAGAGAGGANSMPRATSSHPSGRRPSRVNHLLTLAKPPVEAARRSSRR